MHIDQVILKQINNFGESERNESRTEPTTVKLTDTQTESLRNFSTATGISKSTVISNSLKLYFRFFDKIEKLIRYSEAISSILESLP
jgi:hypothetical protein